MTLPLRILAATALLCISGAASSQGATRAVRDYSLIWDTAASQGEVRISLDQDSTAERIIKVRSLVELNSWGTLLKENQVYFKSIGDKRLYIARRK